jgi:hypothetical protein
MLVGTDASDYHTPSSVFCGDCWPWALIGGQQSDWGSAMSGLMFRAAVVVAVACSGFPAPLSAQPPAVSARAVELEGQLAGVAPGLLQMEDPQGAKFLVQLPDTQRGIQYLAETDSRWLNPSMFVRFEGTLDSRMTLVGSIDAVEVFNPMPAGRGRRLSPQQVAVQTPGIYPMAAFAEPGAGDQPPPSQAEPGQPQECLVVGQLAVLRPDALMVQAGGVQILVPLGDQPLPVKLELYGMDLAQLGDRVKVVGLSYPSDPSQVYAERIEIRPSKPLLDAQTAQAAPGRRGSARPPRQRASSR